MAINTYSLKKDGNKYCSAHTLVKEMKCKDGTDKILIDTALMDMVEKLFLKLRCSKYIISSGYRTPAHDKAVGGDGKGYHTKGMAVDACFYDKSGKIIPAQIVCCVAQDLGFKGIANISTAYKYVHLDSRTAGKYYGDEIKHNNTVTDNFYDYFKVSKTEVAKYTGETYDAEPKPAAKLPDITYQVYTGARGWLPNVKNGSDYAGVPSQPIRCLYANLSAGDIEYQVHTIGGKWLPWVKNREDYAGLYWSDIDCVRVRLVGSPGYSIQCRVAPVGGDYFPWVTDNNDYAGVYGKKIDRLQLRIVKK